MQDRSLFVHFCFPNIKKIYVSVYKKTPDPLAPAVQANRLNPKYATVSTKDVQSGPKKVITLFLFCDNFRKCTPILTIFSLLEQEIYGA